MEIDPYELDAQARNKNAKRERTAKNQEIPKTQLPHTRLKADFKEFRNISSSHLDHMADITFTQPVISLYINITPERLHRQKEVFLTVFNSLKHTALQENQSYIDSLPHDQQQSIEQDMWLIQKYIQDQFGATGVKSLALFKSGEKLQRVYTLGVPSQDYMGIDPDPYTLPMMIMLDQQRLALVVQLEIDSATFYSYQAGTVRRLDAFKSPVSDLSLDISRPNKVQRHNYELFYRHLKDACSVLVQVSQQYNFTNIILMGDDRVLSIFEQECLSQDKRQKITAVLPIIRGSTEAEVAEQITRQLQQTEVAEEGYYLDMIQQEDGRDGIVKGVDEVVSAQNRHMIRSLLVDKDLKKPGYYCRNDRYISTNELKCPLCGQPMVNIDNVVEKLVELASQHQIDYKIIRERTDELERYGGIAATMYNVQ